MTGFDALAVDSALGLQSGLAIGGSNLYMGNNGGGEVHRASVTGSPPTALTHIGLFSAVDDRVEDMECDSV